MNNLLSQKWCLCLNVQNRMKLCRAKSRKFGDDTTVYCIHMNFYNKINFYNVFRIHKVMITSASLKCNYYFIYKHIVTVKLEHIVMK